MFNQMWLRCIDVFLSKINVALWKLKENLINKVRYCSHCVWLCFPLSSILDISPLFSNPKFENHSFHAILTKTFNWGFYRSVLLVLLVVGGHVRFKCSHKQTKKLLNHPKWWKNILRGCRFMISNTLPDLNSRKVW